MKRAYVKELYGYVRDGFDVQDMVDVYNRDLMLWFMDEKTVRRLTGKTPIDFVDEAFEIFEQKARNFYELLALAQYLFWEELYSKKILHGKD